MSFYDNDREQNIYETGRTRPPQRRGGAIALVLIFLIFVGGIYSALTSLRPSPPSENPEGDDRLQFSNQTPSLIPADKTAEENGFSCPAAGFAGEFLSALDQQLGHLSGGLYITQIVPGSEAEKQGMQPGDILLQCNDVLVTDMESLDAALSNCPPGKTVQIRILRDGKEQTLELLKEENQ